MPITEVNSLQAIVRDLQDQRQAHEEAIAEIDDVFASLGIAPAGTKNRGRRPGRPKQATARTKGTKRGRRKTGKRFAMPGPESIMKFVKSGGKKGRTGGEIDRNWKKQGRSGSAYTILGQLVDQGSITRWEVAGQRGSVYTVS